MLKNTHPIFVRFYGPTNRQAAKIRLHSYRFNERVFIPFGYEEQECQYTIDKAEHWLTSRGYNCIGMAELGNEGYVIITDTFCSLKDVMQHSVNLKAKSTQETTDSIMRYIQSGEGYSYYVGITDGKNVYNIVRDGQPIPTGGYYNKWAILNFKGVKDLFPD